MKCWIFLGIIYKYHNGDQTLTSAMMIVFKRFLMVANLLDIIESSSVWDSRVECLTECTYLQYVIVVM